MYVTMHDSLYQTWHAIQSEWHFIAIIIKPEYLTVSRAGPNKKPVKEQNATLKILGGAPPAVAKPLATST